MRSSTSSSLSPERIALGYAVIALLWIAFSDAAVFHFGLPAAFMTVKGTAFVLVTAALLYFTIRRLVQDIQITSSERKHAEGSLRQSEAYLMEAQELTHTGSWAFDVASNRYIYLSPECFRIFGLDPQAELPCREVVFRRIHPEDADAVNRAYEKSVREKVDTSNQFRIVLGDGTVKTVHITRHPVLNSARDVVKLTGIAVDITERKQAEEALRESEMRFRIFWDHAADAFAVFDEHHKIIEANREACEAGGYTREEVIGMVPQDFNPDVDAAMLQRIDERVEAGEICTFETRHRRKDGTVFPVEVRIRPFWLGGRRLHLAVSRDISERKRAEEALRRSEGYLAEAQRLSHSGSCAIDVATQRYVYMSEECFRIFELNAGFACA